MLPWRQQNSLVKVKKTFVSLRFFVYFRLYAWKKQPLQILDKVRKTVIAKHPEGLSTKKIVRCVHNAIFWVYLNFKKSHTG
jgi:hypothetical protein